MTDDIPIDPQLQDRNTGRRQPGPGGAKRKTRNSDSAPATSNAKATRRSAAATTGPSAMQQGSYTGGEPSRGEEENLIISDWNRETAVSVLVGPTGVVLSTIGS